MCNPKHKTVTQIFVKDPHPYSQASLIKLQREYRLLDIDCWNYNKDWRRNFLYTKMDKDGKLVCAYCGKRNLQIKVIGKCNQHMLATVDHVRPLSKGGSKYNINNFKVCCPDCNLLKDDRTLEEFMVDLQASGKIIRKEKLSILKRCLTKVRRWYKLINS